MQVAIITRVTARVEKRDFARNVQFDTIFAAGTVTTQAAGVICEPSIISMCTV
jgi:hypothetical protein